MRGLTMRRRGQFDLCGQEFGCSVSGGQQSVVSDFVKPGRQYMHQKASDKLFHFQGQHFFLIVILAVFVSERDFAVCDVQAAPTTDIWGRRGDGRSCKIPRVSRNRCRLPDARRVLLFGS